MSKLAVIVLTKNEEKNIADVIANAKGCADEVVIVDSGSTDGTVTMAQALGARVVYRAWDHDFAAQRNFALTQTDADWVLYLDADERMDDELVQDVHKKVNQAPQQYAFTRRAVVCDYTFHHGAFKPDQVFRLFPRQAVVWENKVHERPVCSLAQKQLAGEVKHYTYDNWQAWINKMGAYTTIWATDNFAQGKRTSLSGAVGHMLMGFGKMFFLQLGFLDGVKGLISTSLHCSYTLFKYLKLLELQRREGIK